MLLGTYADNVSSSAYAPVKCSMEKKKINKLIKLLTVVMSRKKKKKETYVL